MMKNKRWGKVKREILFYLREHEEISVIQVVANYCGRERSSVSRAMYSLKDEGYVHKRPPGRWVLTLVGIEKAEIEYQKLVAEWEHLKSLVIADVTSAITKIMNPTKDF